LHDDTETTAILPAFDPANFIVREYIVFAIMTMSHFCISPQIGHLDRLKKNLWLLTTFLKLDLLEQG
jgi:hypothetical protein